MRSARLVLADGTTFEGKSFGGPSEVVGEVVFNTSMFGYQEILTDPSYVGQIVTMAYPHIGSVGTTPQDDESAKAHAVGLVVKAYSAPSNWRSSSPLEGYLNKHQVAGIEGLDTRRLVRHLRTHGSQMGVISTEAVSDAALTEKARHAGSMEGQDLASGISTNAPYAWSEGTPRVLDSEVHAVAAPARHHVVAIDYGLKRAMLRYVIDSGCRVTVVPAGSTAAQVLAHKPDGVFLTNGPGDPAAVKGADKTVAALLGKVPVFGICLGHQILALALGGRTYKMKFGHRGANQPVQELSTRKVEITSQNHGFAVDEASVKGKAVVSHINLNDRTVEGLSVPDAKAFSVQYHPEASPGPHDAQYLFARFVGLMAGSAP
ncbi:MAG: glutamine-hydrolyzing carbamoyl-phosphate synthase small subunit [Myxococcaceae bacterium]|nr:glutamine-hydrolyzing carbamoyl-phosphate synthase small subunit [Myxococcaceae bacterium]